MEALYDMQDIQSNRRPARAHAERIRRGVPRERRPINWRRRLKIGASGVVALLVIGVVLLGQQAAALNDAVSTAPALSMRLFGPFSPERVNVLLLGYSDETRGGAYLADSMNVISIDKAADMTSIIGIPRDLWVEGIEEVPQNMKINEAFRIGYYEDGIESGASLASEAVSHVLGIEIHGWLSTDFRGFERLIDAVGGVTIRNPRAFRYTWGRAHFEAGDFRHRFDKGELQLNGKRALDYARSRYTNKPAESSDFARSVRQQRVLAALKDKIAVQDLGALAGALRGHFHTNVSVIDLAMLARHLDIDRRVDLTEGEVLEATTNTIGQYTLVTVGRSSSADYAPLHRYIEEQLAAPPAPPTHEAKASP